MSGDPRSNGRHEVLVFLGFVALVGAIVITVLIATNRWSSNTWTAIGSVGAFGQAVGVIVGLVYAANQLGEARRERRDTQRRWRADRTLEAADAISKVILHEILPRKAKCDKTIEHQRLEWETDLQELANGAKSTSRNHWAGRRLHLELDELAVECLKLLALTGGVVEGAPTQARDLFNAGGNLRSYAHDLRESIVVPFEHLQAGHVTHLLTGKHTLDSFMAQLLQALERLYTHIHGQHSIT